MMVKGSKLQLKHRPWSGIARLPEAGVAEKAALYNAVLSAVLAFLDANSGQNVSGQYPTKYGWTTPLSKLSLPARVLRHLAGDLNKRVSDALVPLGHPVAGRSVPAFDMPRATTIGNLVLLACAYFHVAVPARVVP